MDDKRTTILITTLELISERGFHNTPMSLIARQAKVGAGTIYRYFKNKEDLINALFCECKQNLARHIRFDPSTPVCDQFLQVWGSLLQFCIQNPEETRFIEQFHNSPYLTAETEAATSGYLDSLAAWYQKAIDQELIKPLPVEMLIALTYNTAISLAKLHLAGRLNMNPANRDLAAAACWDAISR